MVKEVKSEISLVKCRKENTLNVWTLFQNLFDIKQMFSILMYFSINCEKSLNRGMVFMRDN